MRKTLLLLVAVIPLIGQDCIGVHYEVTVEPDRDGCKRTVKARSSQEVRDAEGKTANKLMPAKDELKRIAALYGQAAPKGDTVTGRFAYQAPSDVGGAGFYARFDSPLGTTWGYVERVRGNDDLASQIDRIRKGADETVPLLSGWFRAELGDSPQADKLCAFIDGPFRRDVENIALYFWAGKFSSDHAGPDKGRSEAARNDLWARMAAYVLERGYIRPADLPVLIRAGKTETAGPAFMLIQRLAATKMGVPADQAIPRSLAFLADPETARTSLSTYLAGTEQYRKLIATHQRENPQPDKAAQAPDPMGVLEDPLSALAVPLWGFMARPDAVKLSLRTTVEPTGHNGTWDPAAGKVNWASTVRKDDEAQAQLPAVFWALWDKPDVAFQTKHFGKGILGGQKLARYCLWYKGLTPAEARQWDAIIAVLKPGDDLKAKLFDGEKIPDTHYARAAVELLAAKDEPEGGDDDK